MNMRSEKMSRLHHDTWVVFVAVVERSKFVFFLVVTLAKRRILLCSMLGTTITTSTFTSATHTSPLQNPQLEPAEAIMMFQVIQSSKAM